MKRRWKRPLRVPRVHGSRRWTEMSVAKRKASPLCEPCEREGFTEAATSVNHIKTVKERPDLAFEWDNLESVCDRHKRLADSADLKRLRRNQQRHPRIGLDGYIVNPPQRYGPDGYPVPEPTVRTTARPGSARSSDRSAR